MIVIDLLALLCKVAGTVFLFAAALGLLRFRDPFQRMHAATKSGTLGAGLAVLGTVLQLRQLDATLIGLATVAFLLLTIPVAGHLLGRAAYVSGASLDGLRGADALEGILPRADVPLGERDDGAPERKA